jgi:hypothetical protein
MGNDGREFIWLVPDVLVVCDGHPPSGRHHAKPFLVWAIRREVFRVSLHSQTRPAQNLGELQAEITVREEGELRLPARTKPPARRLRA